MVWEREKRYKKVYRQTDRPSLGVGYEAIRDDLFQLNI